MGKVVSKTVRMVVLITAAGPRVATQRTCWLACSGLHLSHCRQRGEQPAVSERLLRRWGGGFPRLLQFLIPFLPSMFD